MFGTKSAGVMQYLLKHALHIIQTGLHVMFWQESIFKKMKHILTCLLVVFAVFSCKRDEEHQLQNKYPVVTQPIIQVDNTGVTIKCSVEQYGEKPIVDHGFVWSTKENPTLSDLRISLGALDAGKNFQARIEHDLKPNQTYYVRAYSATSDFIVYSDQHSFVGQGSAVPVVYRVGPSEITCYMQKIVVYGKNFCNNKNDINLNYWGWVESASRDSIVINLQRIYMGTNTFELSIYGKTVTVTFEAVGLVFEDMAPRTAEVGSVVTIKGRHLSYIQEVSFTNFPIVEIVEKTDTEIKIKIPALKEGPATLRLMDVFYHGYYSPDYIELPFNIISPWKKVEFPFELTYGDFHNYQDKLYTMDKISIYQLDVQNKTYQMIAKMPEEPFWDGVKYFMMDSKFYICMQGDLFLRYDVTTGTWEKQPSYTENFNYPKICFSIHDKAYVCADISTHYGDYNLFEYDTTTKLWRQVNKLPHIFEWPNNSVTTTVCNGKAYIINDTKIFEFDPQTNNINEKISGEFNVWRSFTYNNKVYILGSAGALIKHIPILIEYDPVTNQLRQMNRPISDCIAFLWKNLLFTVNSNDEYVVIDLEEQW